MQKLTFRQQSISKLYTKPVCREKRHKAKASECGGKCKDGSGIDAFPEPLTRVSAPKAIFMAKIATRIS
jgi:hypothetical protein